MLRPLKLLILILCMLGGVIAGYKNSKNAQPSSTVIPEPMTQLSA